MIQEKKKKKKKEKKRKRKRNEKPRRNKEVFCIFLSVTIYLLMVCLPLGFTNPLDVEDAEVDIADRSISCLSSSNALFRTSWSSIYLCFFKSLSSGLSFPKHASCDISSASIILLRTSEQRGKKRFPSSTAHIKRKRKSGTLSNVIFE
jgi:hypothetical protein